MVKLSPILLGINMKLFSKEKDIILKIVNSILIVGSIISIIIVLGTGISLLNKPEILTYEEYAKEVCTLDKLEYEGTDEEGREKYNSDVEIVVSGNYRLGDIRDNQADLTKSPSVWLHRNLYFRNPEERF